LAAAVAAAHSRHFLSVAETAAPHLTGPDQAEWLARLDTDHANLRRAAEHAASDPGGTAQVLRFGVALRRYWMARSRHAEALTLLLPVLARPEAQQDPELLATALVTATHEASMVDIATARPLGEQALGLARQLDSGHLLIESLAVLADIYCCAGEAERGLPLGRAVQVRRGPGQRSPQRRPPRFRLRRSGPGLPGRGRRRVVPGRRPARRRAVLRGPDGRVLARSRSALPPGEPRPAQANLGHEQTGDAYARGLALSFEDAIDLAAGRSSPPGRHTGGRRGGGTHE
jgi:hypothetical protein